MKKLKIKLRKYYSETFFFPGITGLFLNSFYFARRGLAHHISALAPNITGATLDVGCGTKPYQHLFNSSEYLGLEIDSPENRAKKNADIFYNGSTFPFKPLSFDSIVANQVFEHVFNPEEFLSELNRVLKQGGNLLITVPFVWDEHEQPHDFARYSSFGLKFILDKHGFEILQHRKSVDDIRVIFQLLNAYIYKKTVTKSAIINVFITFILISPFNILGELISKITPKNQDLYLDNVVLARKK